MGDFFEALKKRAANALVRNDNGTAVYSEEWAGINATIKALREMMVKELSWPPGAGNPIEGECYEDGELLCPTCSEYTLLASKEIKRGDKIALIIVKL